MKHNVLFERPGKKLSKQNVFVVNGSTGHTNKTRVIDDYYATNPLCVKCLLEESGEHFNKLVWEPAVGGGSISEVLKEYGHDVRSSDIVDRGYPGTEIINLYNYNKTWYGDIITNPPYKGALEFVEKCLDLVADGFKVAMLLKLTFLEGIERRKFFDSNPPKTVAVLSHRMECAPNGDFEHYHAGGAIAYAWYIWEKGYKGRPYIVWIN